MRTTGVTGWGKLLVLGTAMVLLTVACGGDDSSDTASTEPPLVALDGTVNNHGTKDLGTAAKLDVELDDLYFAPTFIKAKPGSEVEIVAEEPGRGPAHIHHRRNQDQRGTRSRPNVECEGHTAGDWRAGVLLQLPPWWWYAGRLLGLGCGRDHSSSDHYGCLVERRVRLLNPRAE